MTMDVEVTTAPRPAPRLALIESIDGDGRVQQAWDVSAWPVRLGRALDNELVLHDPHAAAHHAVIDVDADGRVVLQALASRNGIRVDEGASALTLREGQQAVLAPLALWHVGTLSLRVRRPQDPLPTEQALSMVHAAAPRGLTAGLATAVLAWTGAMTWLENNPASTWEQYLPPLVALLGGFAGWASLWGLASKIFVRRFAWLPHLRVALGYVLAILVAEGVLALVAYMFDWPWASRIRETVGWAIGAAMLAHHMRLVAPTQARRINASVSVLTMLAMAWVGAVHWQRTDRVFDELYLATLPPPAWRLAGAQPPQALIDDLRSLEAPLRERARKAAEKETEP